MNFTACSARFRAHPVDKTKFEVAFAENLFAGDSYQSCPSTLVWRQDQCMCGWMDPEKVETCNCCGQGLKSHKSDKTMYMRLVNGDWLEETCNIFDANQIWDNEKCNCVWDPNKPQTHKASVFKAAVLPNGKFTGLAISNRSYRFLIMYLGLELNDSVRGNIPQSLEYTLYVTKYNI